MEKLENIRISTQGKSDLDLVKQDLGWGWEYKLFYGTVFDLKTHLENFFHGIDTSKNIHVSF